MASSSSTNAQAGATLSGDQQLTQLQRMLGLREREAVSSKCTRHKLEPVDVTHPLPFDPEGDFVIFNVQQQTTQATRSQIAKRFISVASLCTTAIKHRGPGRHGINLVSKIHKEEFSCDLDAEDSGERAWALNKVYDDVRKWIAKEASRGKNVMVVLRFEDSADVGRLRFLFENLTDHANVTKPFTLTAIRAAYNGRSNGNKRLSKYTAEDNPKSLPASVYVLRAIVDMAVTNATAGRSLRGVDQIDGGDIASVTQTPGSDASSNSSVDLMSFSSNASDAAGESDDDTSTVAGVPLSTPSVTTASNAGGDSDDDTSTVSGVPLSTPSVTSASYDATSTTYGSQRYTPSTSTAPPSSRPRNSRPDPETLWSNVKEYTEASKNFDIQLVTAAMPYCDLRDDRNTRWMHEKEDDVTKAKEVTAVGLQFGAYKFLAKLVRRRAKPEDVARMLPDLEREIEYRTKVHQHYDGKPDFYSCNAETPKFKRITTNRKDVYAILNPEAASDDGW